MDMDPNYNRTVIFHGGYSLSIGETLRDRPSGMTYELRMPDGTLVFRGSDFGPSPMHAHDSDETFRSLLGFLTLRPGDTDSDYFDSYTPVQIAWRDMHAEDLQQWAIPLSDGGYPWEEIRDDDPGDLWWSGDDPETLAIAVARETDPTIIPPPPDGRVPTVRVIETYGNVVDDGNGGSDWETTSVDWDDIDCDGYARAYYASREIIDNGCTEYDGGSGFSDPDGSHTANYGTGERVATTCHLYGFTPAEIADIVSRVKSAS